MSGGGDDGWGEARDDLARRRAVARAMGGADRLARHRAAAKVDARARVEALLDAGTFRELGTLVGGDVPADAIVAGSGLVRPRAAREPAGVRHAGASST